MCPTEPRDDDLDALHRDPAARGRVAAHDHQPAAPRGRARLARVAVDHHGAGHDVLGQPDARVAVHAHRRALVHARRSSSRRGRRRRPRPRRRSRPRRRARRSGRRRASAAAGRAACRRALSSRSGVAARSTDSTSAVGRPTRHHDAAVASLPRVHARRLGLPHLGRVRARQHGDRAVLRGHRDPVVGLGHHGGLARDRVAQHGEAVGRADRERVEAVEVVQAASSAASQRGALAQPPVEVARGDLGVVVGLELDPLAPQHPPQPVVVRERAVVDEAQVEAGGERVRALRRDLALRRHARVPEPVGAAHGRRAPKRSTKSRGLPISL